MFILHEGFKHTVMLVIKVKYMSLLRKQSTTTCFQDGRGGRVRAIFTSFFTLGAIEFFYQLFLTVGGQIPTIPARKTRIY